MTPLEKATKTAEGVVVNGLFFPRWLNSVLAVTACANLKAKSSAPATLSLPKSGLLAVATLPRT
jgi:hypothetical protein